MLGTHFDCIELWLLDEHLTRILEASTEFAQRYSYDYFSPQPSRSELQAKLVDYATMIIHKYIPSENELPLTGWKVKLLLDYQGQTTLEHVPLNTLSPSLPIRGVVLAKQPVEDTHSIFVRCKTTQRKVYDDAWRAFGLPRPDLFDVILWNVEGRITEGCISNIAVEASDERTGALVWKTPALGTGLLNGCLRQSYLERGKIVESDLTVEDLVDAARANRKIICFNSVRGDVPVQSSGAELTEYEKQRQEKIALNKQLLASLEIPTAVFETEGTEVKSQPAPRKRVKCEPTKSKADILPRRSSKRLRGANPDPVFNTVDHDKDTKITDFPADLGKTLCDDGHLLSADAYFPKNLITKAIHVDGHYHGWINPDLIPKHGFETNAQNSWEKHGGGQFSFANPLGEQDKQGGSQRKRKPVRRRHTPVQGWSEAKFVASKLFLKNPNAYFYRHNEPGVDQWTGDWKQEERELFLQVAKEHGCGDKWGLFASYIPHRVGYQCSNYYRQVILPECLIIDPNYKFNGAGQAIYVGPHMRARV
ncbi:hypothetical protein IWQ61_009430 [Dispira simplex]|nr:hypothetical protein IWQ61_009430 [Dispira simplex]